MPHARMHNHARAAAVLISALTTVGLGLATASPAAAAPDNSSLDSVQARADRLAQQADAAAQRHDTARTTLDGSRRQLDRLTTQIQRERHVMDSLRSALASTALSQYDASGGSSAPASPAIDEDSSVLLTNVTSVSTDTGARGEALARTNDHLQELADRRTAVRDEVTMLSGLEKTLRAQQAKVDTRSSKASNELAAAEQKAAAERMAKLGGAVVAYAKSQVGKSYVYGAAGPSAFDCSGLTMMAWSQAGVSLPHNSAAQYNSSPHIPESELQPGDLVFYYTPISHVGMYVGNGQVVNALNPRSGVQVSGLHDMPYVGAVRPG